MGKLIIGGALFGWAGIIGLAWWLANTRIGLCNGDTYTAESICIVRATAVRDNSLIIGLTVALLAFIALAVTLLRRKSAP